VEGPGAALLAVDALDLPGYLPYHLTRAELLVWTGRTDEARRVRPGARAGQQRGGA
jgi:predicted RNA polymerase sigma factor